MALCACKCLNVTLESDNLEEVFDIGKLELSLTEQRDIFFSEELLSSPLSSLKSHIVQPALVGHRIVGCYTIESCLACEQSTHAISHEKNNVLIVKSTQTSLEHINNLKRSENFSPVFNLLVPEVTNDIEMKENVDINSQIIFDKNGCSPSIQLIGTLRKQLNQTLQSQLESIEETVRQFRDQKYAEYEAYRERAQRDHKILASIVNKKRSNVEKDSWANNGSLDNGPPSPLLPPLQRRRLSSIKDEKKFNQNVKTSAQIPHEEDSLDNEDIFDLEGTDSRHYMASDQDDYDSDHESKDEGRHIVRSRAAAGDIARSLPINMPKFPMERPSVREVDDYEETQDIAASIKALARSVHGDVFELPRPRFSTQI
ncbi:unnamed protein product [Euphydryas editha]|uniref:Uncharacterized protein n=1 Tax=Euphydryas editha TaxID=104508 RepID=A0AAU9U275_EUPED|nr:unnamed protein product [Euphydryas editha]